MTDYPSITCPRCGRVSYSQGDIDNKFCVVCGFHDDFGVPGLDRALPLGQGIKAPWSAEQVAKLNEFQRAGVVHPFTCPGDRPSCQEHRELVATPEGWVCACGAYRQGWAHDFMFAGAPS